MGNSHLYKQWKSRFTFMLFVTPASLFLMLFWLVPIAAAIGISFTDWDYMTSGFQMTGWANYQGLLKDKAPTPFCLLRRWWFRSWFRVLYWPCWCGLPEGTPYTPLYSSLPGLRRLWLYPLCGPGYLNRMQDWPTSCCICWACRGLPGCTALTRL